METADDAGVYRLDARTALVQTVDFFPPLVDDPETYGRIAAANALSDVYAMNGRPLTALNIVGFPDDELDLGVLAAILRGGAERVAAAGAALIGGHSVRDAEIKYGLSVTGLVDPADLLTNATAQMGDALVLTKPLGTGFVTTANKKGACPPEVLEAAVASMVQLNAIGRDALREAGGAHALTDVTGFGLAGHASEMAEASRLTIELDTRALPRIAGSEPLAVPKFYTRASRGNREFLDGRIEITAGADPLGVEYAFDAQTSGGLLIAVDPAHVDRLIDALRRRGALAAEVVGRVVARRGAVAIVLN
ncbi:MAG: selenide, water dikinase [Isosphaeraceae bacterium]|jgi:selenide,water dikinase|nr:MAG: selenide, water dikinase [Isosphaeraceae bacterium]